ncbi:Predicted N-acyltransferase, GNAT family [Nitrosomonas ureae]|uniref:Predicted N-acyltransferase, GNAT family n=1 Tax=Nitrosomonas ureae TaxID=44577 RepID=A0A285BW51_9PROT|nr:GNAT family N-acetyltransferase [Nitrosomonas ureae]SNX59462.1 Predicted N-acyltransferase, GNAT family [Nitrosomonas ureae]
MRCDHLVRVVDWETETLTLRNIRTTVFILEQQVPVDLEWDEFDIISTHFLVFNNHGEAVGTGRLLPDGHIGRMAVLKEWRGKGYGSAMLKKILEELRRRQMQKAMLNAQINAVKFYEKFGFQQVSAEKFIEAGIPHVKMMIFLE